MGIHFQAGIMASEILRSFEEWLDSVTDEELLAALEEVDAELAAAQKAAKLERVCQNIQHTLFIIDYKMSQLSLGGDILKTAAIYLFTNAKKVTIRL